MNESIEVTDSTSTTPACKCASCLGSKAVYSCEICNSSICKSCRIYSSTDQFDFYTKAPEALKKSTLCPTCFEANVEPEINRYEELLTQANEIYYLSKAYRGNVRVLRRHTKRVVIESCADRRECILRMAFQAAQLGMNAIMEAEIDCKKQRIGGYQTHTWFGSAMPAKIDGERLELSSLKGF